jgi:hypothetical protein
MKTPATNEIQSPEDQARDLVRYREGVETLMQLGSSKAVSNGIPAHASILFEVFFKHCSDQVRIFCKNLNAEVFSAKDLLEAAKWALKNGKKIRVVVQEQPEPSPFLDLLRSAESNVELLLAPSSADENLFNFAVMDEKSIRVEPDRRVTKASASMNLPEVAKSWATYFDAIALRGSVLPS